MPAGLDEHVLGRLAELRRGFLKPAAHLTLLLEEARIDLIASRKVSQHSGIKLHRQHRSRQDLAPVAWESVATQSPDRFVIQRGQQGEKVRLVTGGELDDARDHNGAKADEFDLIGIQDRSADEFDVLRHRRPSPV